METSIEQLKIKAADIKWLFTDVDGTLTDGCVYVSPQCEALKRFSLRDGTGFFLLRQAGVKVGIITGENSAIVTQRAKKLEVDALLMNAVPKVNALETFCQSNSLKFSELAYIGDDINDIRPIEACGLSFAVADCDSRVSKIVDYLCIHPGGNGAFREAAEKLLQLKGVDINMIIHQNL